MSERWRDVRAPEGMSERRRGMSEPGARFGCSPVSATVGLSTCSHERDRSRVSHLYSSPYVEASRLSRSCGGRGDTQLALGHDRCGVALLALAAVTAALGPPLPRCRSTCCAASSVGCCSCSGCNGCVRRSCVRAG